MQASPHSQQGTPPDSFLKKYWEENKETERIVQEGDALKEFDTLSHEYKDVFKEECCSFDLHDLVHGKEHWLREEKPEEKRAEKLVKLMSRLSDEIKSKVAKHPGNKDLKTRAESFYKAVEFVEKEIKEIKVEKQHVAALKKQIGSMKICLIEVRRLVLTFSHDIGQAAAAATVFESSKNNASFHAFARLADFLFDSAQNVKSEQCLQEFYEDKASFDKVLKLSLFEILPEIDEHPNGYWFTRAGIKMGSDHAALTGEFLKKFVEDHQAEIKKYGEFLTKIKTDASDLGKVITGLNQYR